MKKQILTGAIALMMLSVQAQTMVVDLKTGRDHNPNNSSTNPSYPLMQVAAFDDTWKVLKPGTNTYVGAYVNTGWEPSYMDSSRSIPFLLPENMKGIDPFVQSICPEIYIPSNPPTPQNPFNFGLGDIAPVASQGRFLYRMQFNINKNCSTITAARLVIASDPYGTPFPMGVLTGDHITGMKLNGFTVPLPVYSPNNYLDYNVAMSAPNSYNYWNYSSPYWSSIPDKTITLNPADFSNGTNSFYVIIDTNPNQFNTALLMMDAHLEIDYTLGGSNNALFNLTGSSTSLCQGSNGVLNVGLNVTNPTSYNLSINLAGVNVAGSASQQSFPISPASSTNYAITITSPPTVTEPAGCVTTLNWPVNLLPVPTVSCPTQVCAGSTDYITVTGATGGQVKVTGSVGGSKFGVFNGTYSSPIAITPTSNTSYIITITDLNGCTTVINKTVTIVLCAHKASGVTGIENYSIEADISISPNPGQGLFSMRTNGISGSVQLFDVSGKLVKHIEVSKDREEYSIDLSGYSKGIYLLTLDTDTGHLSKRIILE